MIILISVSVAGCFFLKIYLIEKQRRDRVRIIELFYPLIDPAMATTVWAATRRNQEPGIASGFPLWVGWPESLAFLPLIFQVH